MGWLPSWLGGDNSSSQIDPELRTWLNNEAPKAYVPTEAPTPPTAQSSQTSTSIPSKTTTAGGDNANGRSVPRQSLYADGRYADLWKTYKPQAQIEAETATEHDKMTNMLEAYRDRKVELQRIAMENCSEQQEEWANCMKHGKLEDQLQMCRHQVRRFERCYTMQTVCTLPSTESLPFV